VHEYMRGERKSLINDWPGREMQMIHAGLPPQFEERWEELYWRPLQARLRA
jgi:hypothetical protein